VSALPGEVVQIVGRYLALADRLLPGRVEGSGRHRRPSASTRNLSSSRTGTARNLEDCWRPWAEGLLARAGRPRSPRSRSRWTTAWSALGTPRLHHTIATGEVIAKEAAGEHALATFDDEWHPVIDEGLRWWRGAPPSPAFADPGARARRAAELALMVVDDAARS
jgi:hypothetical protein